MDFDSSLKWFMMKGVLGLNSIRLVGVFVFSCFLFSFSCCVGFKDIVCYSCVSVRLLEWVSCIVVGSSVCRFIVFGVVLVKGRCFDFLF